MVGHWQCSSLQNLLFPSQLYARASGTRIGRWSWLTGCREVFQRRVWEFEQPTRLQISCLLCNLYQLLSWDCYTINPIKLNWLNFSPDPGPAIFRRWERWSPLQELVGHSPCNRGVKGGVLHVLQQGSHPSAAWAKVLLVWWWEWGCSWATHAWSGHGKQFIAKHSWCQKMTLRNSFKI